MAKDLIIGGASNYDWDKLKYWVNSIKKTGFKGDIVICASNIDNKTIEKLTEENVKIAAYGEKTEDGFKSPNKNAPHVERFFYLWHFLSSCEEDYRFVTVTDTRDVIFQKDPAEFLSTKLRTHTMIASSEGLLYKDEPWGNNNLLECFGPFFHSIYNERMIYNVGVIAGYREEIRDFLLMLFQMSLNRPIPIVDQAVYNFMLNQEPYASEFFKTDNKSEWAIQLGTTKYAVEAGKGDLGSAGNMDKYLQDYKDIQPMINGSRVSNGHKEYCIVHQWDRVPSLSELIMKEYGD